MKPLRFKGFWNMIDNIESDEIRLMIQGILGLTVIAPILMLLVIFPFLLVFILGLLALCLVCFILGILIECIREDLF